ncbi:MAG: hypothetical protein AAF725_24115, partial [Acidobacteriota bacterium]
MRRLSPLPSLFSDSSASLRRGPFAGRATAVRASRRRYLAALAPLEAWRRKAERASALPGERPRLLTAGLWKSVGSALTRALETTAAASGGPASPPRG